MAYFSHWVKGVFIKGKIFFTQGVKFSPIFVLTYEGDF